MRYIKNEEITKDVLQDFYIKLYQKIDDYGGKGSFEGWMRRMLVNLCLNKIKLKEFRTIQLEDMFSEEREEEIEIYTKDQLKYALNQLPNGYRVITNLYAIEGYSHKEISKLLGITESTSKSQYIRAKKRLKEILIELNGRKEKHRTTA